MTPLWNEVPLKSVFFKRNRLWKVSGQRMSAQGHPTWEELLREMPFLVWLYRNWCSCSHDPVRHVWYWAGKGGWHHPYWGDGVTLQRLRRVAGSWVLTPRFQVMGMGLKDLVLCHWKLEVHNLFSLNVYQMFTSGMFHLRLLGCSWLRVAYGKQYQWRKETATFTL